MNDLIVIGGGPAGYVGALRAAQLGKDVLVFEKNERAGGVCLHWGCIPTKALLHLASEFNFIKSSEKYGFDCELNGVNWEKMINHSRTIVNKLVRGIEGLFKKNNVEVIHEQARLVAPGKVKTEAGKFYKGDNILLATGAEPRSFPKINPNRGRIMTSREALTLRQQPESLLVLGGGPIGLELAYIYHSFGTSVKLLEMAEQILPGSDPEVADFVKKQLRKDGIDIQTSTGAERVEQIKSEAVVETRSGEKYSAEAALVALGMQPPSEFPRKEGLPLEKSEDNWLEVGPDYQTSLDNVYGAGDLIGPPLLAHVASAEAEKAVESMFGLEPEPLDYQKIPRAVYCQPRVASFGYTPAEARRNFDRVEIGKFPFQNLGRAVADDQTGGFVKLVFAGQYSELVGAHITGHRAVTLLSELVLASQLEATPAEIFETVHAHPTYSEAVREAALSAVGRALHK